MEKDSRFGGAYWRWVKNLWEGIPLACRSEKSFSWGPVSPGDQAGWKFYREDCSSPSIDSKGMMVLSILETLWLSLYFANPILLFLPPLSLD